MTTAEWIWYPDDFEIEYANKYMAERYERDVFIPPFWKQYRCYSNVKFVKRVKVTKPETVYIKAEGLFNVSIDGRYIYNLKGKFDVPEGEHEIVVSVYNEKGLPCIKARGKTIKTDDTWLVTCNDHKFVPVAYDRDLITGKITPNSVKMPTKEIFPVSVFIYNGRTVYDFGKEVFAFVRLENARLSNGATVYYGESREEVSDVENCELLSADFKRNGRFTETTVAKAFRYLTLENIEFEKVSALAEYRYKNYLHSFSCDNEVLNRIYAVSSYTLELNSRGFLIDGIKRDRWIWVADAYQASLMQYYSFFDTSVIKRTLIAMFGKSPFDIHINHIMDYSFFWIIGFYEYFQYTGDADFISANIYKAYEIMDYCLSRRDEEGLMDSRPEDWVFVDWAELDNSGQVCYEQLLMIAALRACANLGKQFGQKERAGKYGKIYEESLKLIEKFWCEEKGAYVYSYKNGVPDGKILRQPNVMAVFYDLCDDERKEKIKNNVLKNDAVTPITTPYMRFYELSALCKLGETEYVLQELYGYWGGMLEDGATTFWESYDKRQKEPEKYAMYGRKYGKSLCHAWGAGPLYIIGRYIVGLKPENGESFKIEPNVSVLKNFRATFHLPKGNISVEVCGGKIGILSETLCGKLILNGTTYAVEAGKFTEAGV